MMLWLTTDLPEPDFADQGQGRRRTHAEADAPDRLDGAGRGREADVQVLDPQQVGQSALDLGHSAHALTPSASRLAAVASLSSRLRARRPRRRRGARPRRTRRCGCRG